MTYGFDFEEDDLTFDPAIGFTSSADGRLFDDSGFLEFELNDEQIPDDFGFDSPTDDHRSGTFSDPYDFSGQTLDVSAEEI